MASAIKIESGIPIPGRRSQDSKYPFKEMKEGDSFEVLVADTDCQDVQRLQRVLATRAYQIFGAGSATTRINAEKTGVRVWRIK